MSNLQIQVTFHIRSKLIASISLDGNREGICFEGDPNPAIEKMAAEWLYSYFSHIEPVIKLPLDFSRITPFTLKVLGALESISFGQKKTYADVAGELQNPYAARAVGSACGRNPFPLIIPCHRVIRKDGKIGGFACGASVKKRLLEFESPQEGKALII